jgi:hypothetical protein
MFLVLDPHVSDFNPLFKFFYTLVLLMDSLKHAIIIFHQLKLCHSLRIR